MNTTQNESQATSQTTSSVFGTLKSLGRGIAVSSAVAVMGISTMSAADASAAGVSTGIRHTSTVTAANPTAASPTNLDVDRRSTYVIRNGKLTQD